MVASLPNPAPQAKDQRLPKPKVAGSRPVVRFLAFTRFRLVLPANGWVFEPRVAEGLHGVSARFMPSPRRRGANDVLPPISLILAGDADSYVRGLTSYRYTSGNDWIDFFSGALIHATNSSELLAPTSCRTQGTVA